MVDLALPVLREGRPARLAQITHEDAEVLRGLQLLDRQARALRLQRRRSFGRCRQRAVEGGGREGQAEGAGCVVISAKIESEFAVLPPEDRAEFLETLGLEEPGLNRLIREAYALLGLLTYFTAGPKEARAWTITRGTKAPQAAGVIHTDFEKGFIRAETIAYDDYVALNGETGAKDAGRMRLEGKEYVVKDGDVMHFRFAN